VNSAENVATAQYRDLVTSAPQLRGRLGVHIKGLRYAAPTRRRRALDCEILNGKKSSAPLDGSPAPSRPSAVPETA
jgi:hypothetical protein